MSVPLKLDIVREMIVHGSRSTDRDVIDPSSSEMLRQCGVALVTTYIEQLSMLDIICSAAPLFGQDGNMWIGYKLTERGRNLGDNEDALRHAVAPLTGGPRNEVSEAIAELQHECNQATINPVYRDDFLKTLEEIRICFDNECYIAAIALCGKVLEVCLKEILHRNKVHVDPNAMVGTLIKTITRRVPGEYVDPALNNVVNIINKSRITAVHAKEKIPVPSRDQAIMVVFATRDVVSRNVSHGAA